MNLAVYEDHGAIWLGARAIARDGGFETPVAARSLADEVYDPAAGHFMPSELLQVHQQALGNVAADRAIGRANAISVTGGYEVDGPDWRQMSTRLRGSESLRLRSRSEFLMAEGSYQ